MMVTAYIPQELMKLLMITQAQMELLILGKYMLIVVKMGFVLVILAGQVLIMVKMMVYLDSLIMEKIIWYMIRVMVYMEQMQKNLLI